MLHLDLFSGIGGFALATEMVWRDVEHVFVEYDPYCQKILRKHWSKAEIHGDIREFVAEARKKSSLPKPYILTGGFPCQPFSQAGRRRGTEDDRYLWGEMFEAITIFKPRWVIAENVSGLVTWNEGLVLETVCTDLEREGYEVQPFVIPACAVGAPHRRDRVWIVAHAESERGRAEYGDFSRKNGRPPEQSSESGSADTNAQDTERKRSRGGVEGDGQILERESTEIEDARPGWARNWVEIATALCRVDARISTWVDGRGKVRNSRNARLKALGNAIVPQVAEQIMLAIKSVDDVL